MGVLIFNKMINKILSYYNRKNIREVFGFGVVSALIVVVGIPGVY